MINRLNVWMSVMVLSGLTSTQTMAQVQVAFPGPSYREVRIREGFATAMPSIGEVNIVVIPIQFSDALCSAIEEGCAQTRTNIAQAFFGEPDALRWHSVSSYFADSSYGLLTIDGIVLDWFTASVTAVELSNNRGLLTSGVINPAIQQFKNLYANQLPTFDRDGDGFLDAVYFIYSLPFDPEGEEFGDDKDVFWAFVSYQGGVSNPASPNLFHYAWSSYQFMYEDGYYQRSENGKVEWDEENEPIFFPWLDDQGNRSVNAHVYIHEVGHLLGLLDYYSYDRIKGDWGPSGALDMMDFNIGDHNGFSKMALGWVAPFLVERDLTITLSPLVSAPEIILITKPNPTTMMDEYILIEVYQPIGLNQKDSQESFAGRYPRMFTIPGVKIYHIDARIAQMLNTSEGIRFNQYVTTMDVAPGFRYQMAHQNTASRNARGTNPNFKLIHLLESSGINTFRHGGFATNRTLFTEGMSFNGADQPFIFNDGTRVPFTVTIVEIGAEGATLRFQNVPR